MMEYLGIIIISAKTGSGSRAIFFYTVLSDKNTVPPTIEIRVLDQTTEEDLLEAAEGDEAEALDTEASVRYFNIAKSDVTAGEDIDVCISAVGTNDYPYLAKCKKATVGDEEFPGLAVFIIE
jgi:hypothetical protein